MSESLTELRLLMAVVEEGRRDDPTAGMPWALLEPPPHRTNQYPQTVPSRTPS